MCCVGKERERERERWGAGEGEEKEREGERRREKEKEREGGKMGDERERRRRIDALCRLTQEKEKDFFPHKKKKNIYPYVEIGKSKEIYLCFHQQFPFPFFLFSCSFFFFSFLLLFLFSPTLARSLTCLFSPTGQFYSLLMGKKKHKPYKTRQAKKKVSRNTRKERKKGERERESG